MPIRRADSNYFNFVQGLITETTALNFPPNASLSEENFELTRKGDRRRRLGLDFETNYDVSNLIPRADVATGYVSAHLWENVANRGNLTFLVLQIGPILYFHDVSAEGATSANRKPFIVNLQSFISPNESSPGQNRIDTASAKGALVVVSAGTEPLFIEYDPDTDTISTELFDILIRDFVGVDDGLEVDERPPTLSNLHEYNLKNQGWLDEELDEYPIDGTYPSNAMVSFVAKPNKGEEFDPDELENVNFGTSAAPKGRFILKAFFDNKSDVSGIGNLPEQPIETRSQSVTFFQGRAFYAAENQVFVSQVVQDTDNLGRCYQEADPTSEDDSDVVATDGIVISIPEAGNIVAVETFRTSVIAWSEQGVFQIRAATGEVFSAVNFRVDQISDVGAESKAAVVNVEGVPVYLSDGGIYTIQQDEVTDIPQAVNLTRDTIQTRYLSIPSVARNVVDSTYDPAAKRIYWLFNDEYEGGEFRNNYTSALIYDVSINAFYIYSFKSLEEDSPFVAAGYITPTVRTGLRDEFVTTIGGETVTTTGAEDIVIEQSGLFASATQIQFLALFPDDNDTDFRYTIAEFNETDFLDWKSADGEGVDAAAFMITGYELGNEQGTLGGMRQMMAVYLTCYFDRTENEYLVEPDSSVVFDNPSGCLVRALWGWADSNAQGKFGNQQQAYVLRNTNIAPGDGGPFDWGYSVVTSKLKLRGRGRAVALRFDTEPEKDCRLLGWSITFAGMSDV